MVARLLFFLHPVGGKLVPKLVANRFRISGQILDLWLLTFFLLLSFYLPFFFSCFCSVGLFCHVLYFAAHKLKLGIKMISRWFYSAQSQECCLFDCHNGDNCTQFSGKTDFGRSAGVDCVTREALQRLVLDRCERRLSTFVRFTSVEAVPHRLTCPLFTSL